MYYIHSNLSWDILVFIFVELRNTTYIIKVNPLPQVSKTLFTNLNGSLGDVVANPIL